MNRPCHINLFQFIQQDNFRKHLESRVNAFWYCFLVINRYTFHYLMKSAPIPGNQNSFEILPLFDTWRNQILMILLFSSVVILIYDESDGVCPA